VACNYTVSQKKTHKLWNGIAQKYKDLFWRHLAKIFKRLQNRVCTFQFSCRYAFAINVSSFKPDTKNNANFYAVSVKRANFDEVQFFFTKHIPKLIIFGTHNLQTFKYHNTLSKKLLPMQFFLILYLSYKVASLKWRKLCVALFWTFSTSPAACWCCYSSNLYPETLL